MDRQRTLSRLLQSPRRPLCFKLIDGIKRKEV